MNVDSFCLLNVPLKYIKIFGKKTSQQKKMTNHHACDMICVKKVRVEA